MHKVLVLLLLSCCVEQRGVGGGIRWLILANCWREGEIKGGAREGVREGWSNTHSFCLVSQELDSRLLAHTIQQASGSALTIDVSSVRHHDGELLQLVQRGRHGALEERRGRGTPEAIKGWLVFLQLSKSSILPLDWKSVTSTYLSSEC